MKRLLVMAPLVAALAPFALTAQRQSTPPRPARREIPVPFAVGETLTYDVSWSTYLTAGTAVATVKDKKPSFSSMAYYIVAEGRPTPLLSKLYTLYYKMDTLLDTYTLLPQRGSIYSEEGKRRRFRVTDFDRAAKKARFQYQTETTVKAEFAISPVAQDVLSAIYVLRALPLKAGDRMTMPVSDNGNNYKVQLDIAAPERVMVPLGEMNAWRLKPTAFDAKNQQAGRNLAIWISDDRRRLPLKLEGDLPVGSFVLALRDVR